MQNSVINVGKDFHRAPAGRTRDDGPYSGEAFRKNVLVPALKAGDRIRIELDDVEGYGSSFLEEAFGGLVREGIVTARELHDRLELISDEDPSVIDEIWSYIDIARAA